MASKVPEIRFRTEYICLKCGAKEDKPFKTCLRCGGPMCPRVIKVAVR